MDSARSSRLAGLDTLRAIAILAVMGFHLNDFFPESWHTVLRFGWAGVDLFFVLSGYLIGSQLLRPIHAGDPVELAAFYRRRAFRILPAYLVVLALYVFWPAWREGNGLSPLWEFLSFAVNLFIHYPQNSSFSHSWSLCVEEHFYLLLPWLVLLLARRPSRRKTVAAIVAILLLGVAIRTWVFLHLLRPAIDEDNFPFLYIEHLYYPTWTRLDGLLAGVSVALLQIFRPVRWAALARFGNHLAVFGLAITALALSLFSNRMSSVEGAAAVGDIVGYPLLSLGLALLVTAAAMPDSWPARLQPPGSRTLATIAFSLYLTHKSVAHLLTYFFPALAGGHPVLTPLLLFPLCVLAALALFFIVERPFLRLRDRVYRHAGLPTVVAREDPAL